MTELLYAHQGGWDELLLFGVPALLAIFGLRWAERRARRRTESEAAGTAGDTPDRATDA